MTAASGRLFKIIIRCLRSNQMMRKIWSALFSCNRPEPTSELFGYAIQLIDPMEKFNHHRMRQEATMLGPA
jgi:hypothetical protein